MNIDSTDRALLNGLRENARTSFVELAKTTGVSERTVRTRVKMLEEEVIQRYTIIERGVGLSALVRTKLGPGTEVGTLAGEFATWDGVLTCYEVGGGLDADLLLVVSVNDTHDLRELLDRIWLTAPDGAVVETHTTLIIEQY
ncbi:MAG: Lrp/AsnC family transcriptional regulator [Candidatus Poseidoniaceae archaeon]|jgi:DNA-binding Lrp family transcriptional regulator|nr:Lrp/AsnC family transcriptional regulator [Candidatus Poseidoniaceae archaeon]HJM86586.1 Lrp/AsnC family transcriptional regulator [Candidatus Thalassarchaeaceae archaeon]